MPIYLAINFKMTLLHEDSNAKDIRYHNIQKDLYWLTPPNLGRIHVEELYEVCKEILDNNFSEEIKHNFSARYAEMYFSGTLIDRLSMKLSHPSDEGLDFFIDDINTWFEIIATTEGISGNPNSITKPEMGVAYSYPEEKVILRLTNAFQIKANKALADIEKGLIKNDQPIIIGISGGGMEESQPMYEEGGYPQIAKAVLPIGDLVYWIDRESKEITGKEYEYRESVKKRTESLDQDIKTDYFLDENYSHISAVIYSWTNAWSPIPRKNWGQDFYIIHNPLAKNRIPAGSIPCGHEYLVTANETSFTMKPVINHEKS
jgi:hypothetical protein